MADIKEPIEIVPLQMLHLEGVKQVLSEGFDTKKFCAIFPHPKENLASVYQSAPEGKMDLGAVAVDADGSVLGYIQLSVKGRDDLHGLHECEVGEMYIDQVGVSARARGKGLGTRLLNWSEEKARNMEGINRLTLYVVNGNRASVLYERFGFVKQSENFCERCCGCIFTFCLIGRPYGCCHSECGSSFMVKTLS